jgi:hypothetical protein
MKFIPWYLVALSRSSSEPSPLRPDVSRPWLQLTPKPSNWTTLLPTRRACPWCRRGTRGHRLGAKDAREHQTRKRTQVEDANREDGIRRACLALRANNRVGAPSAPEVRKRAVGKRVLPPAFDANVGAFRRARVRSIGTRVNASEETAATASSFSSSRPLSTGRHWVSRSHTSFDSNVVGAEQPIGPSKSHLA